MSDTAEPIRDATQGPPTTATTLTWIRTSSGRFPPETDQRVFLLQLHDGSFAVGRRRTLLRPVRPGAAGPAFVRATAVPDIAPVVETHFVEPLSGSTPIDGVRAWAAIEPP